MIDLKLKGGTMVEMAMPADTAVASKDIAESSMPNKFLTDALIDNKREGLRLAVMARLVALTLVGLLLIFLVRSWSVLYYEALIALFMLNGLAQLKFGKVGKSRAELLLMFLDLALMGITIVVPNPFHDEVWSAALQYKFDGFMYFYILLAAATLSYSWRTMFAVTWGTALVWGGGYLWVSFQPSILPDIATQIRELLADYPLLLMVTDLDGLHVEARIQEIVVFAIVAGILALNGWRSNQLLMRQADVARERANLTRYFAPSLVEHLAGRDQPFGEVRAQPVVVMFVDIVGFTKMAEHDTPEVIVAFLREFHSRMETEVFNHNGTLDKFLGDGLMVTFGTPVKSPKDACNALECSLAMQKSLAQWNEERQKADLKPVRLSVGLHYGNVVLGDIGSRRRLEFAVLGDVVNVASRLEALTRTLDVSVIASDAVIDATDDKCVVKGMFNLLGPQQLRGRDEPVEVWGAKLEDVLSDL